VEPASPAGNRTTSIAFVACGVAGLLFPPMAAAYIDPLSGSIILQVVAAGVLSFVFTMKRSWQWLGGRWNAVRNTLRRR
jgi:hypothetical protein